MDAKRHDWTCRILSCLETITSYDKEWFDVTVDRHIHNHYQNNHSGTGLSVRKLVWTEYDLKILKQARIKAD